MSKSPRQKLKITRRWKKVLIFVEALFIALILFGITVWAVPPVKTETIKVASKTQVGRWIISWLAAQAYDDSVFDAEFDSSKLQTNALKYNYSKEYTNFVMFGVDSRQGEVDASNSDSILIVSIHNTNGKVKMVSVYRDTMLGIYDKQGTMTGISKVNSAFAGGGPEAAINTLNKNLDLDLKDYVTLNFAGVAEVIDTLGGIEVNLNDDEFQQLNKHLKSTKSSTGAKSKKIKRKGRHIRLNGIQAATYCRIRKATFVDPDTGDKVSNDFGRAARQRSVIMKLVDKAKKAGVSDLQNMVNTVLNTDTPKKKRVLATSFPFDDIINMIPIVFNFDLDGSAGFPSTLDTATVDGASYVIPQGLSANVSKLHEFLYDEKDYQPTPTVNELGNQITNKTGISELSEGYDPLKIENLVKESEKPISTDYDYDDKGKSEYNR